MAFVKTVTQIGLAEAASRAITMVVEAVVDAEDVAAGGTAMTVTLVGLRSMSIAVYGSFLILIDGFS